MIRNLFFIFFMLITFNIYSQISIVSNGVLTYKWSRDISKFQLCDIKSGQYSIIFTDNYSNVILIKDGVILDQWINYKGVGVSTINQKKVVIVNKIINVIIAIYILIVVISFEYTIK